MGLLFSQRIGLTPGSKNLQIESMDSDLRIRIWNVLSEHFIDHLYWPKVSDMRVFKDIWHKFFKRSIDDIPNNLVERIATLKSWYDEAVWYEVYDFLEFVITLGSLNFGKEPFVNDLNKILEEEFSGYRLVNGIIAPISNPKEKDEIEEAINQNTHFTALAGVDIHLASAVDKVSDKSNPDYRNSIKESISAVEVMCRVITRESTLGKALQALEKKGLGLDQQLKVGFEKIYAYTNNNDSGIRHAIIEEHKDPQFEEAKFMLVSCSAFINYIIGKCVKLEIPIK